MPQETFLLGGEWTWPPVFLNETHVGLGITGAQLALVHLIKAATLCQSGPFIVLLLCRLTRLAILSEDGEERQHLLTAMSMFCHYLLSIGLE